MSESPPDMAAPGRARGLARILGGLGLVLPAFLAAMLALHTISDLDIWLHDRVGQDILTVHRLPDRNGYSFTNPDQPWTDHEWLFQVLLNVIGKGEPENRASAWIGLSVALTVALIVILWRDARLPHGRRWPGSGRAAAVALPIVASLALLWVRLEPRPELFSLVALALLAGCLDRALRAPSTATATGRARWLVLVSPRTATGQTFWLTVVWAQWHGFWLLAPGLWLLAVLLAPLDRRLAAGSRTRPAAFDTPLGAAGPVVAALLAGLLTPNHIEGLVYPFRALLHLGGDVDLRVLIAEMAPLMSTENHLGLTVLAFQWGCAWTIIWLVATAGRVPLWRAVLMVAGFAAAAWSQRNLGLCAVAFVLGHTGYDGGRQWLWARWKRARRTEALVARAAPAFCVLLVAAVVAWWAPRIADDRFYLSEGTSHRFGRGLGPAQFPIGAARHLRELRPDGNARIANDINAASTLVNQRAGRVFVDGRTEAYTPAIWREYLGLRGGGEVARGILERRQVEAVLLAHSNQGAQRLLETMLAAPEWRVGFADEAGILFLPAAGQRAGLDAAATVLLEVSRRFLAEAPAAGGARLADECLALGKLLKRVGLEDAAVAMAKRGLESCPDHPQLNHNRGNQLLAAGDVAGAIVHFRRALAASPGLFDTRLNLGVALFRQGDPAAAARVLRSATKAEPGRFEAWANLAEAYLSLGEREQARKAFAKAMALKPGDAKLRQRAREADR